MLLRNIMGAATYSHHAYEAFRTLRATAEGKTPFKITDVDKLRWMCSKVGINTNQDINQMAKDLADVLETQMKIGVEEPNIMVEHLRLERKKVEDIGIYPAGVVHEEQNCIASCLTNVDGNHVSLAMKALRLGLATIQCPNWTRDGTDILLELLKPHEVNVD